MIISPPVVIGGLAKVIGARDMLILVRPLTIFDCLALTYSGLTMFDCAALTYSGLTIFDRAALTYSGLTMFDCAALTYSGLTIFDCAASQSHGETTACKCQTIKYRRIP
ncbi:hypothetical protein AVEN_182247-1 [Araneus ventricosus]|uniref:Uncharacterized protein n=1 Tax=Araneus ventricosus TaxID=182803 RepID=A0A4Y2UE21_ARAVE|nr:hypothetical protein AVEN_182247-1 [Araneus ventricosus]